MFRFIHTSDLHLGKRFGNMPADLAGRLREARHTVLETLAQRADEHGVTTVLIAGDTFDTETPPEDVWRQAFAEMRRHTDLTWVIMPGNHDSLQATLLWKRLSDAAGGNVIVVLTEDLIWLAEKVVVLPAPCTARRPGRDLSAYMDGVETDKGVIRIGLAHGAVLDFSEDGETDDVIAIDRARTARLDYLALGDWHGRMSLDARTWYSGSPEPDRFKHAGPGEALLVTIDAAGAVPSVAPIDVGSFAWMEADLHLTPGEDARSRLGEIIAATGRRRQTLLRIAVTGHADLESRLAIEAEGERIAPEFALFDLDLSDLQTDIAVTDLDEIEKGGTLRSAAEALLTQSRDEALDPEARTIAGAALNRLFSLSRRIAS